MRDQIHRKRRQRWEAVCGVCCFIAGIVAPILGMFLLAVEWLTGLNLHPWLHAIGTTLLIVGIPLIVFAGFCLDWAEGRSKESPPDKRKNRGVSMLVHDQWRD